MTETTEAIKIQRGLKGVYFDRSPCTFIDGKAGELRYRGYSIHDLAENRASRKPHGCCSTTICRARRSSPLSMRS